MPTQGIYNPALPDTFRNLSGSAFIPRFIANFMSLFMAIGMLATFLYLVYGGIMWITAGGDAKRTEAAGKQITNALIGMLLVAAGWAFIQIVGTFLGINILTEGFKIPKLSP